MKKTIQIRELKRKERKNSIRIILDSNPGEKNIISSIIYLFLYIINWLNFNFAKHIWTS